MNNQAKIVIALLRQPHKNNPSEMRSDPFWEFGSFGLTGCHKANLLHPKKVHELTGIRIAFVQGGAPGFKLVFLTPPVAATSYGDRSQISWPDVGMPFRYEHASIIISPDGHSDVPEIIPIIKDVCRTGWMGRFASKFRSRREPLPEACARQFVSVWNVRQSQSRASDFACTYTDALPYCPPTVDCNRQNTFNQLLARASAAQW